MSGEVVFSTKDYSLISLDHLASIYASHICAARIYQLFIFWILIEALWVPLGFVIAVLFYGVSLIYALWDSVYQPGAFSYSFAYYNYRILYELPWFVLAWVCFYTYTTFKKFYPVILFVALGLGHNLYVAYVSYDKRPAAEKYPLATVDLTLYENISFFAFLGGLAVVHLYFLWLSMEAQVKSRNLDNAQRKLLSEHRDNEGVVKSALRILNIPPAIRMARKRIAAAVFLFFSGLSNFRNYLLSSVVFLLVVGNIPIIAWYSLEMATLIKTGDVSQILRGSMIYAAMVMFILVTGFLMGYFILALGRWATNSSRKLMLRSLEDAQAFDPRPPIMFLRSFSDDQVALKPQRGFFKQWYLDETSRVVSLDHLILKEGTEIGPTVALGNPDDPVPPYGVARGYFEHSTWKDAVSKHCDQAKGIVLVMDTTAGIEWEVGHLFDQNHMHKTLVLLKQDDWGTSEGYSLLAKVAGKTLPDFNMPEKISSASADYEGEIVGFWIGSSGRVNFLITSNPNTYFYTIALRMFLRDLPNIPQ